MAAKHKRPPMYEGVVVSWIENLKNAFILHLVDGRVVYLSRESL